MISVRCVGFVILIGEYSRNENSFITAWAMLQTRDCHSDVCVVVARGGAERSPLDPGLEKFPVIFSSEKWGWCYGTF